MRIRLLSVFVLLLVIRGSHTSVFSKLKRLPSKIASKLPVPNSLISLLELPKNWTQISEQLIKVPETGTKNTVRSFLPKGLPVPISKYDLFGIPLVGMGGKLVNEKPAIPKVVQKDVNKTDETGFKFDFSLKKIGLEANYAFPTVKIGPFAVKPAIGGGCMIKTPLASNYHVIEDGDNFAMGCSQFKCRIRLGRVIKFPIWLPDCFRRPGVEVGERCCIRPDNLSKGGFVSCAETNIVTWLFGLDGRKRKILGLIPNYLG